MNMPGHLVSNNNNSAIIVHRCRFLNYEPSSVSLLSVNPTEKLIAVGRSLQRQRESAGSGEPAGGRRSRVFSFIEIWSLIDDSKLQLVQVLPYRGRSGMEALAWCRGRLFSASNDGSVSEHSIWSVKPVATRQVSATPIWCMTTNPEASILATGNDDGTVHLISVSEASFEVQKTITGFLDSRILCLAWDGREGVLVGGSMDMIQMWDVEMGRALERMAVGRGRNKNIPTAVWALALTPNMTVVSGDSLGRVSFWNGRNGTLIASHSVHDADVLALQLQKNGTRVMASGIDPKIQQFDVTSEHWKRQRVEGSLDSSSINWKPNIVTMIHSHDVRALASLGDWLVSGGLDSLIGMSRFPPKTVRTYPSLHPARIYLAKGPRLLMIRYTDSLCIWRLGNEKNARDVRNRAEVLELAKDAEKLLEMRVGKQLVTSALSDDGLFLAYSSTEETKIFRFDPHGEEPSLSRLECTNTRIIPPGMGLRFTPDTSTLLLAHDSVINKIHLTACSCTIDSDSLNLPNKETGVRALAVSWDQRFCAVLSSKATISIFSLAEMKFLKSRKWGSLIIDLKFGSVDNDLLFLLGTGSLGSLDSSLQNKAELGSKLTELNRQMNCDPGTCIIGFSLSSDTKDAMILTYSSARISLFTLDEGVKKESIERYEHVTFADFLSPGSLIVVEITPEKMAKSLPPALLQKKFGTG